MISKDNPFFAATQLFEIEGNVVLTRGKVASTTCASIVHNNVSNFPGTNIKKIQYKRLRDLCNYYLFDNKGKLDVESQSSVDGGVSKHFFMPDNEWEEKMIENVVSTFRNIVSGKSNKKIYILCREPREHWSAAIFEDLKYSLNQRKRADVCNQLEKYFDDKKWEDSHKQLLFDYKNGQSAYYEDDSARTRHITELKKYPQFQIEDLYFYMTNRYLNSKGRNDHGVEKFNEFREVYFRALWWMVINPFKTVEGVHHTNVKSILYNMISQHYHPYLTKLWILFSRTYYPEYVKWVDIDRDNLKLIKRTSKLEFTNTRDYEIKDSWNMALRHILTNNNSQHPSFLDAEIFVYDAILEYNKR